MTDEATFVELSEGRATTLDPGHGNSVPAPYEPAGMPTGPNPMHMINTLIAQGKFELIPQMIEWQERWDKIQARKLFDLAIARAKSEIPPIKRNRHVGFESRKAGAAPTSYMHEDLAAITKVVDPIL